MYYRDPDGNRVELQIDNFPTAKEGQDWLKTPAFDRNPIGVQYDPDDLVKRFNAGVPVGRARRPRRLKEDLVRPVRLKPLAACSRYHCPDR